MNNNQFSSALALLSLSLGLAACDGGSGDNSSGSGVDGSKALTELDATEQQDLCEYNFSHFEFADFDKISCYSIALAAEEPEEDCQTVYDACIADADDERGDPCNVDQELPACAADITVAEVEACAREQGAVMTSLADSLSCASDPSDLDILYDRPPACKSIETQCPEVWGEQP